jgi:uncharacterized protein YjiS (DUF1127 family)
LKNRPSAGADLAVPKFRRPAMLHNLIARYRIWQLRLDTTRHLENVEDRLLADMGIERDAIRTIARRNASAAMAAQRQAQNAAPATSCEQPDCGLVA